MLAIPHARAVTRRIFTRSLYGSPVRLAVPEATSREAASQRPPSAASGAGASGGGTAATSHGVTARVQPEQPPPPSVNSTELGAADIGQIRDPHTHDPLKWKKAAWKYVGAVLTFGVAYKALHWYVDALEAEARQRRQDVEIAKTDVHETAADRAARRAEDSRKAQDLLTHAQNPFGVPGEPKGSSATQAVAGSAVGGGSAGATGDAASKSGGTSSGGNGVSDTGFQVFRPVRESEDYVSPEDELRVLELELEAQLKKLREVRVRTRENDAEKRRIKDELRDVRAELKMFEAKAAKEASHQVSDKEVGGARPGEG